MASGKKVCCDCGTVIRGSSDPQLIADVQAHAKSVHNLELTPAQILSMAEPD
jgi:predicted small metal-binding protein